MLEARRTRSMSAVLVAQDWHSATVLRQRLSLTFRVIVHSRLRVYLQ